jgi:hypothetical protein
MLLPALLACVAASAGAAPAPLPHETNLPLDAVRDPAVKSALSFAFAELRSLRKEVRQAKVGRRSVERALAREVSERQAAEARLRAGIDASCCTPGVKKPDDGATLTSTVSSDELSNSTSATTAPDEPIQSHGAEEGPERSDHARRGAHAARRRAQSGCPPGANCGSVQIYKVSVCDHMTESVHGGHCAKHEHRRAQSSACTKADLGKWEFKVMDKCCGEGYDCTQVMPRTCGAGCAEVFLPVWRGCADLLSPKFQKAWKGLVAKCQATQHQTPALSPGLNPRPHTDLPVGRRRALQEQPCAPADLVSPYFPPCTPCQVPHGLLVCGQGLQVCGLSRRARAS